MAAIRCKLCGGTLAIVEGASTAVCEYCGVTQTIPKADDEKKLLQFERAEKLRKQCEFDKAAGIYESIVADFRDEAEAYWGLVLCKFGIEYVDDPATGKKIPTCHRSSFDSIMDDSDFEQAMENTDSIGRRILREEAKQIEALRKNIIAVSANEQPYDIFICYKETAENGDRTLDSVLAQDVYDALIGKGYRVFFSRITLEDKLGVEYEPYIFAALNSAKVMLVFGTDYEYFNAVWVKNEWSRFLKLMAQDKEKHLIPCYKDIDAYDMPKEFAKLQSQNLGKVGATQDLLRGIEKILPKREPVKENMVVQQPVAGINPTVESYLKRVFMFLEDGEWSSADEYCEKVLDIDPENASAYLGKLLAELKAKKPEKLKDQFQPFSRNNNFQKALRFSDDTLRATLIDYDEHIKNKFENQRLEETYINAFQQMNTAMDEDACLQAAALFEEIAYYKDSAQQAKNARAKIAVLAEENKYRHAIQKMHAASNKNTYMQAAELFEEIAYYKDSEQLAGNARAKAEVCEKDSIYNQAIRLMKENDIASAEKALKKFGFIPGWKDADTLAKQCTKRIEKLKIKQTEQEKKEMAARKENEQRIAMQKHGWRSAGRCQHCGGEFKGLFTKKCSCCGKSKDY